MSPPTSATGAASLVPAVGAPPRAGVGPLTFGRLKWVSFTHSCIYFSLLLCAFALSKPEPLTFVLGLSHGLLWIAMSLACIFCVRLRIVPLRLAVAVAVLGGIGPFFGSWEFVRQQRRRAPVRESTPTKAAPERRPREGNSHHV